MKVDFILTSNKGYITEELVAYLDLPSPPSVGASIKFKNSRVFWVKSVDIDYDKNMAEVIIS